MEAGTGTAHTGAPIPHLLIKKRQYEELVHLWVAMVDPATGVYSAQGLPHGKAMLVYEAGNLSDRHIRRDNRKLVSVVRRLGAKVHDAQIDLLWEYARDATGPSEPSPGGGSRTPGPTAAGRNF